MPQNHEALVKSYWWMKEIKAEMEKREVDEEEKV